MQIVCCISKKAQRVHGDGMAVRNIVCLPALTVAWRQAAGDAMLSLSGAFPKITLHCNVLSWCRLIPIYTINMSAIGDDVLQQASTELGSKTVAIIIYNSNPVMVAP